MDNPNQAASASPPNYIKNIDFSVVSYSDGVQKVGITLTWADNSREPQSILLDIEIADEFCQRLAEKVMEARRRVGARQN